MPEICNKIYNVSWPHYNYVIDFPNLDITYFEIPKTGSSSLKHYLMNHDLDLPLSHEFNLGHGYWESVYPQFRVRDFSSYRTRRTLLVAVRDPVERIKSGYRDIYRRQMGQAGSLSVFMRRLVSEYLDTPPSETGLNHFKPQSWFVPGDVPTDPRTILIRTSKLKQLPEILQGRVKAPLDPAFPHANRGDPDVGEIDMSESEIKAALRAIEPRDFALYGKAGSWSDALVDILKDIRRKLSGIQ